MCTHWQSNTLFISVGMPVHHSVLCIALTSPRLLVLYPSWGHVKIIKNKSFQSGFRSCVSHRYCTLTTIFACPVLRCWKALRSWTTACCLGSTTSTKRRGRGRWKAPRVTAMRKGPWPSRRLCTPQPWSPSRGELPAEGLLTQTTREFGQRGEQQRLLGVYVSDFPHLYELTT